MNQCLNRGKVTGSEAKFCMYCGLLLGGKAEVPAEEITLSDLSDVKSVEDFKMLLRDSITYEQIRELFHLPSRNPEEIRRKVEKQIGSHAPATQEPVRQAASTFLDSYFLEKLASRLPEKWGFFRGERLRLEYGDRYPRIRQSGHNHAKAGFHPVEAFLFFSTRGLRRELDGRVDP